MFTPKATEVLLKTVRLSYVHLMEPYTGVNQSKPKYSTTILLPKSDVAQKQAIDAAIASAIEEGRQKYGAKSVPAKPKQPVWDGDGYTQNGKEFGPEAKGHWSFTAWQDAKYKVEVVDMSGNPITDHTQVYSGMYANVLVNFYYYDNQSQGVGCSLGPVQKVRDGESLGGAPISAASVFGAPQGSAANVYGGADAAPQINPITGQPM